VTTQDGHFTPAQGTIVPSLLDYLRVLGRRKVLFLFILVLVPAIAVAASLMQTPTYQASAEVLVSTHSLAESITGTQQTYVDPARVAQTRAELARVPAVVDNVLTAVPSAGLDEEEFLRTSAVSTTPGSDLLTFSVKSWDPTLAKQLATEYAHAFTAYQQQLETEAVQSRLDIVRQQLADLEASGATATPTYRSLQEQESQLAALAGVQTPSTQVVRDADRAPKVGPRTIRNGFIAFCLGLVLALIVVFLADAVDTRVRSVDSIRGALGVRLLGRLPAPPSRLRKGNGLVMLADPTSHEAEPFRVLRASLDFANADHGCRTIMITSAVAGEGKSTTTGNLAVALARAGRRVIVIDADLSNPRLHRLFGLDESPGLTDLELGEASLLEALRPVALTDEHLDADRVARKRDTSGSLEVLPSGSALEDPDELLFERTLVSILQRVRGLADIVLIDAPPLLMGQAIALTAHVDGVVAVARLKTLRTSALQDLSAILDTSPATKLGFILTGVDKSTGYSAYPANATQVRRAETRPRPKLTVAPPAAARNGEMSGEHDPEPREGTATTGAPVRESAQSAAQPFGGLSPSEAGKRSGQSRRAKAAQRGTDSEHDGVDAARDAYEDA
jgi:succinoglycan biosynthesis transport protein ExoP